jgi:hypothetical protein
MKEVYLFSDQPTTCPLCGLRSEIISDHIDSPTKSQEHCCPSSDCGFEFIVEE